MSKTTGPNTALAPYRYQAVPAISAAVPRSLTQRLVFVTDSALKNGVHIVAGPGSGKSRMLGRLLAWQALVRQKPLVVLDPTGGVVDNVLDKMMRLPLEYRKQLWPRLMYVDLGATDFIVPSPLYYWQTGGDTLFAIANRFLGVLKRQDPDLHSAPILGWNSLYECGLYAGQIAAALGMQIDFVAELVTNPRLYKDLLTQTLATHPELTSAVTFFRELMDPNSGALRSRRTDSFRNKLIPFNADPTFLAAFAAPRRSIDWPSVVQKGQTVLIDARGEHDPDRRQFRLLWWFRDFIDYIKQRGMTGRGQEVTFMIDEVTQLLGYRVVGGQSLLAEDLEELTTVLGRNYGVNVVISHQNMSQVEKRIQNVLLQMGTQCIGVLTNDEDAVTVARILHHYNPYMVRKREPVWMSVQQSRGIDSYSVPMIIDHTTTEFTADEQVLLVADMLRSLSRFTFLLRSAESEGNLSSRVRRISIARADQDQYPNPTAIDPLRRLLRAKCGIPIAELLAAINQRRQEHQTPAAKRHPGEHAILKKGDEGHDETTGHRDLSVEAKETTPHEPDAEEAFKEALWTSR